jgi:DNA polymerase-3 subunit delta'
MTSLAASPADAFAAVPGQGRAIAELRAAVTAPVHAYALIGSAGGGGRGLARAFAAELVAAGTDGEERARHLRLAEAETHPDLHVFERTGPYITADQARAIVAEAARSPIEAARKVLVLCDFHLVERAAPMLLKAIEEPSPTTVFVVLADHVPPELVAIASRCVRIEVERVPDAVIAACLVDDGVDPEQAAELASAAGGDLARARLLVTDERFALRRRAWRDVAERLDGTGATVSVVVRELAAHLDDAQAALDARHKHELDELTAHEERYGTRRSGRRQLSERQKREVRRLRVDELRFGLGTMAARYRDALTGGGGAGRSVLAAVAAVAAIDEAAAALARNPNESLLLQALLLELPPLAR